MAEIHVQTKKHTSNNIWIWIVLALVIVAAVVYYLMTRNKTAGNTTPPANTTSAVKQPAEGFGLTASYRQHNTVLYTNANNIC